MIKKIFVLCSLIFITFSCKNENNDTISNEEQDSKKNQNFSVELDVMASKKDDFALYYTEDNTINFTSEMALWHGVSGGDKRETIVFDLSEEKIPTDIRLDFGMNKEQESVTIYNVKLVYYGNEFAFKGSDFFKYFIESKDFKTELDMGEGSLTVLKNGPEYKTPFFYPNQALIDALKNITTQKN